MVNQNRGNRMYWGLEVNNILCMTWIFLHEETVDKQKAISLSFPRGHSSYINCVGVFDTFVVTGSADSTIRKWDMTSCECLFVYEGHKARIQK